MSEILTESFCERCGTRYTFESATPKGARLKGLKVVSRGLRNFVMSDDTSIDEAMAAARNETDREVTSRQLDAFHKTFNFCMSCRQYTCGNCWNEVEGRCLSCAPTLGEVLPSPFPNVETVAGLSFLRSDVMPNDGNGHDQPETTPVEPMAWPTSDLMREEEQAAVSFETVLAEHEAADAEPVDVLARLEALESAVGPEPVEEVPIEAVTVEPEAELEPEPEPIAAAVETESVVAEAELEPVVAEAEPTLEPEAPAPPEIDDRAAAAASQTADLFRRFSPGQNLDDAIAAYERTQVAADAPASADADEPAPEPEPTTIEAVPEPVTPVAPAPAPAPEPITVTQPSSAPEPEPETEPVAAVAPPQPEWAPAPVWAPAPELDRAAATARPEPEQEPVAPTPEPVAAETRDDLVPQPTWQVVAPDTPAEPEWPAQPEWPPRPEWPAQPEWPNQHSSEGLPFLGRPAQPTGGIDALWAESAREVADASSVATVPGPVGRPSGGVQPCVSCGLSLSASARFCRRCGSRQG